MEIGSTIMKSCKFSVISRLKTNGSRISNFLQKTPRARSCTPASWAITCLCYIFPTEKKAYSLIRYEQPTIADP